MAYLLRTANREARSRYILSLKEHAIKNMTRILDLMQAMIDSGFTHVKRNDIEDVDIIINFTMPRPNHRYTGHISYHFDNKKGAVESAAGAFHIVLDLPDDTKIYYRFAPVINNKFLEFIDIQYKPVRPNVYGGRKLLTEHPSQIPEEVQRQIHTLIVLMNRYKLQVAARPLQADALEYVPSAALEGISRSATRKKARTTAAAAEAAWENNAESDLENPVSPPSEAARRAAFAAAVGAAGPSLEKAVASAPLAALAEALGAAGSSLEKPVVRTPLTAAALRAAKKAGLEAAAAALKASTSNAWGGGGSPATTLHATLRNQKNSRKKTKKSKKSSRRK